MASKKRVIRTTHEPNKEVAVTVANKANFVDGALVGYEPTVTIKVKVPFTKQPFEFNSEDELADFVGSIDVEDPQMSLV